MPFDRHQVPGIWGPLRKLNQKKNLGDIDHPRRHTVSMPLHAPFCPFSTCLPSVTFHPVLLSSFSAPPPSLVNVCFQPATITSSVRTPVPAVQYGIPHIKALRFPSLRTSTTLRTCQFPLHSKLLNLILRKDISEPDCEWRKE